MKKLILSLCAALAAIACHAEGISVIPGDVRVERAGRNLAVGMTLDMAGLPIKSGMSLTVTPVLTSQEGKRLDLPAVTVAGRSRYYNLKRERDALASDGRFLRHSKGMAPLDYAVMIPYESWMRDAGLSIETNAEGCCSKDLGMTSTMLETLSLTGSMTMQADFAYVTPEAEAVKVREIEGSAYIDFKVNRTDILPNYGHNPGELAKIRASVDAIRDNSDTGIRTLTITGYASPDGPYRNNERLAKGRTGAVADYVSTLYSFPPGTVTTSWVAEDWDGVRRFLRDNPSFGDRDAILSLVDSGDDPDSIDSRIREGYPVAYHYMLENVYPPLRHTDYRVEYEVRSYTTVEEIERVFRMRPADLSLQELFVLARSYPEGSDEYSDVFETAVRLFPDSEVAALNAAFVEMGRGDYVGAARNLARSGDASEAVYAQGLLSAFEGDLAKARELLEEAQRLGVEEAESALENLSIMENEQ